MVRIVGSRSAIIPSRSDDALLPPHQVARLLDMPHQMIAREHARRPEAWRIRQPQLTENLPEPIDQKGLLMREVVMALSLALGPVPRAVGFHHSPWSRQSNEHAAIDEDVFEKLRTLVVAVNEQAMHAKGMAKAKRQKRFPIGDPRGDRRGCVHLSLRDLLGATSGRINRPT